MSYVVATVASVRSTGTLPIMVKSDLPFLGVCKGNGWSCFLISKNCGKRGGEGREKERERDSERQRQRIQPKKIILES